MGWGWGRWGTRGEGCGSGGNQEVRNRNVNHDRSARSPQVLTVTDSSHHVRTQSRSCLLCLDKVLICGCPIWDLLCVSAP
eukprot:3731982-Prymnesium_polylepis.1